MLSTAIGIQFDVNDLDANYEVIGSSDNYSFQYNLGKGKDLVDFPGDTAQKTISLKGNYGDFVIRVFAVSDIGIRSAFIEDNISVSPPFFDETFTFSDIRVENLPQNANVGSITEIEPSSGQNLLAVNSEYVGRNLEISWRLAPPVGHAKEGQSLGSELLSDRFLEGFSLQIRNTENGDIISSSDLNNSVALQQTLSTSSVADMMDAYTGFSFNISDNTLTELNLDRTLALEVVSNDMFGRQATGVLTGVNYLPYVDTLSYNLKGSKISFSWSFQDTDFLGVEINSLGIPGEKDIYDPYSLQNSIDYYKSLNSAQPWETHVNYRSGDKVFSDGEIFQCIQSYAYSDRQNVTTSDVAYWSGLGEPVDFFENTDTVEELANIEYAQIWGYNYYYSFQPSDGYGPGELKNLTETGLSVNGELHPFKSDVKIDNLSFIEREDDLIFRWNVTDQNNNLVDLNQHKFLIGTTDRPSILGISGSLFDSDTNKFLTGITDGVNSRTSVTEDGVEIIVEDLPGTKVFEIYEYTREINNQLYKVGGFPEYSNFSVSGKYNSGENVIMDDEFLFTSTDIIEDGELPRVSPLYSAWSPGVNYVFRTGDNYSSCVEYNSSIYSVTGLVDGQIIGPSASGLSGIFDERNTYLSGDLVIAPSEYINIYNTGEVFDFGDSVLHHGSIYTCINPQGTGDSIFPSTGISHWASAAPFSNYSSNIYKATSLVPANSKILPASGFNHWEKQNPETSDSFYLFAERYDLNIINWADDLNFQPGDFVVYNNDIWSGVLSSGPDEIVGPKAPTYLNSIFWETGLGLGHDFSTNHQQGDKVYFNGSIYKCLSNNPTGAPLSAVVDSQQKVYSSYENSQWKPYWELNTGYDDIVFKHIGIPESGKRSVGLELGILSPEGDLLTSRRIIGNNPEPSILPQGFQVDSLSNVTKVRFNFNYAFGSREQTTKVQLYRSENPNFSILGPNGLPGSGASSFVSEILGPGDSTFGENITSITDEPPIPHISGLGDQITGYYYKILPFDVFGSGDLFNVTDNQGDLERVLVYPHGYNNQNKNGYMGPVFSTTEDAIPGPVVDFAGDTAFKNYFLNWKLPESQFDLSNNLVSTSPNDISHYEVWQSEQTGLYFGTKNEFLTQEENLLGYRKITGDLTSVGPIPSEINDPASGITNATNIFNVSALSPSVQVTHRGEPNDKRYFWVRAVDHAGNKGPFTGEANLNLRSTNHVLGLDLILGQAKTTDIADFEQNITQTFPNNIALVPNNPFKNNYPSAGEISWDRHFLYHEGDGYVIGPGTASSLDQYVYWSSTGQTPTHNQSISALTTDQSGELGLGQIGGGSNLLTPDISNPLRNIKYSGGYDTSSYHPAGEGVQGLNQDSERPSLLGEIGDYIIARNSLGTATPMWHAFANALIGTAHIQEAAITNAKIHNLTADKIRSAEIFGQDIQIGGDAFSGQIRSAGFGNPVGKGFDGINFAGAGFAISGNGSFVFKGQDTPTKQGGKIFYRDGELNVHGNIRQKDGTELTVLNINAEPSTFDYSEDRQGNFIPDDPSQEVSLSTHFYNSDVSASGVRFRMTDPDGVPIFGYSDHDPSNFKYDRNGFLYDPADPASFDQSNKIARASFLLGDRLASPAVEGFDTIIHPSASSSPTFLSVNIFVSGVGTSTEDKATIHMLSQGAPGATGKSPIYRGVWRDYETRGDSSTPAVNYLGIDEEVNGAEALRGDLVYFDNSIDPAGPNGDYYIAILNNGPGIAGVGAQAPSPSSSYWNKFGAQFESVATNLLLAKDAVITKSLVMGSSDSNNPEAGVNGKIISSDWANTSRGFGGSYSGPGFMLSVNSANFVEFDVGGPGKNYNAIINPNDYSYIRYSSSSQKIEIKGSFINNNIFDLSVTNNLLGTGGDPKAVFIGGGYNNQINNNSFTNLDCLASSIVGGGNNLIQGRFSIIGNGYGNQLKDNFSVICGGFENKMPLGSTVNEGSNIIGSGYQNEINGGSIQGVLGGAKNVLDNSSSTKNINEAAGWASVLKRGVSPTSYLLGWISNTWLNTDENFNVLGYWPNSYFFSSDLAAAGDSFDPVDGWAYANAFGWFYASYTGTPNGIYQPATTTGGVWAYVEMFTSGQKEWVLFFYPTSSASFYKETSGVGLWFQPAYMNNAASLGTFEHGSGKTVYRSNNSTFYHIIINSSNEVWYSVITTGSSKTWYKK